jgi:pilus assembly protein CpaC
MKTNREAGMNNSVTRLLQTAVGVLIVWMVFCGLGPVEASARDQITMYQGEVSVLEIGKVERVAIGNPKVASNTILPNGQLVLLADTVGVTTVHIWLSDGGEQDFDITVTEKQTMDNFQELTSLLRQIHGVHPVKTGDLVVVRGVVPAYTQKQFSKIMSHYSKDILDLTTKQDDSADIRKMLAGVPNVTVTDVGGRTVVRGEVNKEYDTLIKTVQAQYPGLLNLTRVRSAIAGKMIYMKVRIMEVSKSVTEKLGIDWGMIDGIVGPSAVFGVELSQDGGTVLNAKNTSKVLTTPGGTDLTTARGYFGIATGITSILNLYEGTGDAISLAEPRLSTRSGGKAEFLAGGEIPMPVTSAQGQTNVQFKKYGIILNIQPTVDENGNILAHLETEISTIDKSYSVGDIPGLKSRKTNTDISMRAGQTLVISGLLQDLVNNTHNNVKWLADLHILGPLFGSKNFTNNRSELVIFVTPYIYDADSQLNRENLVKLDEMQLQFDQLTRGSTIME